MKRDGPNQGRGFFKCQRAQAEQCTFFQWDEPSRSSGSSGHLVTGVAHASSRPQPSQPAIREAESARSLLLFGPRKGAALADLVRLDPEQCAAAIAQLQGFLVGAGLWEQFLVSTSPAAPTVPTDAQDAAAATAEAALQRVCLAGAASGAVRAVAAGASAAASGRGRAPILLD